MSMNHLNQSSVIILYNAFFIKYYIFSPNFASNNTEFD